MANSKQSANLALGSLDRESGGAAKGCSIGACSINESRGTKGIGLIGLFGCFLIGLVIFFDVVEFDLITRNWAEIITKNNWS